jgi:hypothetical protein
MVEIHAANPWRFSFVPEESKLRAYFRGTRKNGQKLGVRMKGPVLMNGTMNALRTIPI